MTRLLPSLSRFPWLRVSPCQDWRRALSHRRRLCPIPGRAALEEQGWVWSQAGEPLAPGAEFREAPKHSVVRIRNILMRHLQISKCMPAVHAERNSTLVSHDRIALTDVSCGSRLQCGLSPHLADHVLTYKFNILVIMDFSHLFRFF